MSNTINTTLSGQYQNQINELPTLSDLRYENIFKVYKTELNHYYYNILNTISLPSDIDSNTYYTINYNSKTPWTVISYNAYGTTDLWWLIIIVNQITNPIKVPSNLTKLKIIKPEYVRSIIMEIQAQLA